VPAAEGGARLDWERQSGGNRRANTSAFLEGKESGGVFQKGTGRIEGVWDVRNK
jgi:hypothetical protein